MRLAEIRSKRRERDENHLSVSARCELRASRRLPKGCCFFRTSAGTPSPFNLMSFRVHARRIEHGMATGKFFEAGKFLDCNPLEDPDALFTLQREPGNHGHLLFDSCPKCADTARERIPD